MAKNSSPRKKLLVQLDELEARIKLIRGIVDEYYSEQEGSKPDYAALPGIEGYFDGVGLVTETGERLEVPANYAAKSMLLYGDRLKRLDDNGTTVFKNISRQKAARIEGVLAQKEGSWWLLCADGSYKLSDTAAQYQGAKVATRATALVPENNRLVPWAALEDIAHPPEVKAKLETAHKEASKKVVSDVAKRTTGKIKGKKNNPAPEPSIKAGIPEQGIIPIGTRENGVIELPNKEIIDTNTSSSTSDYDLV